MEQSDKQSVNKYCHRPFPGESLLDAAFLFAGDVLPPICEDS